MFWNYLNIALRNFLKSKILFSINYFGLILGFIVTFILLLFLTNEYSYDKFHSNYKHIYRILTINNDFETKTPLTNYKVSPLIKDNFSEILYSTRIGSKRVMISCNNSDWVSDRITICDQKIFDIFDLKLIEGNYSIPFPTKNSIIITKSLYEKLTIKNKKKLNLITVKDKKSKIDYIVSGIIDDSKANSSVEFNSLVLINDNDEEKLSRKIGENFLDDFYQHYILVNNVSISEINKKINEFLEKFVLVGLDIDFELQNLGDIYLNSADLANNVTQSGNIEKISIFFVLSILILSIVIVNYIILSTSLYSKRSKEIGIRKTFGASKKEIILQIIMESTMTTLIAFFISIIFVHMLIPSIELVIGKEIVVDLYTYPYAFSIIFIIVLCTGFTSGSYLAFLLASYNPVAIFRGNIALSFKSSLFKNILIGVQLVIVCGMLSFLYVIRAQLVYILDSDMGFMEENLIIVNRGEFIYNEEKLTKIKKEILDIPNVENVTLAAFLPPSDSRMETIVYNPKDIDNKVRMEVINADNDFISTMEIKIQEGNSFSNKNSKNNSDQVIVNQKALKDLGISNAVGKNIIKGQHEYQIIGVVKDFHLHDFYSEITPMILTNQIYFNDMAIRINENEITQTLTAIERKLNSLFPDEEFNINFFQTLLKQNYNSDINFRNILDYFMVIILLISSIGLIGFSIFSSISRIKEIGLRKVFGASKIDILKLFLKDYVKIVSFSNIISIPFIVYFMHKWLENFSYKINIGIYWTIITFIFSLVLVVSIVSISIFQTASKDTVKILSYE
jgi:putative ABC transport system permease protein